MNQDALDELERLRAEDEDGLLRPEAVVDAARSKTSPLHEHFTWNNSRAAEKYRLIEARQLIRVAVTILPRTKKKVRAYVSLTKDRADGGGYRQLDEVLTSRALRRALMLDAAKDLLVFKRKFHKLREEFSLQRLFSVIDEALSILEDEDDENEETT